MLKIWAVLGLVLLAILLFGPALGQQTADDWNDKGIALSQQGKYDEAMQAFDKAIEIDPQYAMAWKSKGNALANQGKYDEAIQAYDKAIELNPNNADAWYNKGTVLGKDLGKYDEAISAFDKAIEINPQDADVWYKKGLALKILGRTTEAEAAFVKAKGLEYTGKF